jgi:membrane-bound metal-dependent hydrolase YbcI (DUF457 family)
VKGIAHFVTGVAIATFFPEVVYGAAQDLTFGPLLGGLAGLLPDTLDFKFVRYFERLDEEIDPAKITTRAGQPDPQAIAERIAAAMNRAYEGDREVKIRLHTLRLSADLWRQYSVCFDLAQHEVEVRIGPVVTTGQVPLYGSEIAGSEVPGLGSGRAQVRAPILHTYDGETVIDIFSGPSLAFEREGDAVRVTFLPWHRAWTHSLFLVLLLGAAGLLIGPVYGLIVALAALAHIFEDQMGFMGANLLFPVTRRRAMGWRLFRSGDAVPNFLTVWVGLATILLNLDRFSASPLIPVLPYLLVVIVLPCLLLLALWAWVHWRARGQPRQVPAAVLAAIEALDETVTVDV